MLLKTRIQICSGVSVEEDAISDSVLNSHTGLTIRARFSQRTLPLLRTRIVSAYNYATLCGKPRLIPPAASFFFVYYNVCFFTSYVKLEVMSSRLVRSSSDYTRQQCVAYPTTSPSLSHLIQALPRGLRSMAVQLFVSFVASLPFIFQKQFAKCRRT